MTVLMPLTRGLSTLIDETDLPFFEAFRWQVTGTLTRPYASRYIYTEENGKKIKRVRTLHRDLMGLDSGYKIVVDHINRNTLDNRRCNLRVCSQSQNNVNRGRFSARSTSAYRGVFWRKDCSKWGASVKFQGVAYFAGVFESEEAAARAYDELALAKHGEFAVLNFPRSTSHQCSLHLHHSSADRQKSMGVFADVQNVFADRANA
jgi:hypothetical protein